MQTTYGTRLKQAREHANLSQSELARRCGIRAQAIQYLEDPDNAAQGSKYTPSFSRECSVSPTWLETGRGNMLDLKAAEPGSIYILEMTPAKLATAIDGLRPDLRQAVVRLVLALSSSARHIALGASEMSFERASSKSARRRSTAR